MESLSAAAKIKGLVVLIVLFFGLGYFFYPRLRGESIDLGDSKFKVVRVLGTPSSVGDKMSGDIWWWGGNYIEFREGKVREFSDAGALKVSLTDNGLKAVALKDASGRRWAAFSKRKALRRYGTPDAIYSYPETDVWWWGESSREFSNVKYFDAVLIEDNQMPSFEMESEEGDEIDGWRSWRGHRHHHWRNGERESEEGDCLTLPRQEGDEGTTRLN